MAERLDRFWVGVATALLVVTAAGMVTLLLLRPQTGEALQITQPETQHFGQAYVGGAVTTPGLYPVVPGDTIEALLASAGGATPAAAGGEVRLIVPEAGESASPQKVDLNRAEPWLLEAVPGIGPATSKAIVEYRAIHGPFHTTKDLLDIPGIGETTFQRISAYVTVGE